MMMQTFLGMGILFALILYVALFSVPIFRALILFPYLAFKKGLKTALYECVFSLFLFFLLVILEVANLTGFSWDRMGFVSEAELIDSAIQFQYPNYSNLIQFKENYSDFTPQTRYWGSWNFGMDNGVIDKLLGFTRYQVRLPEGIVILDRNGKALFSRSDTDCPGDGGCPITPPDNPIKGIVGTVQSGPPNYEVVKDFSVEWEGGEKGKIFKSGHCFSAVVNSRDNPALIVIYPDGEKIRINTGYGFYLVSVRTDARAQGKITKEEYLKSETCNKEARESWPNVGGYAWRR